MATRLFPPFYQFEDADGKPLVGGTLEFYESGTSMPKDTYSDAGLTIPNGDITLNSLGRSPVAIFASIGEYRVVLKDADGVDIGDEDPIDGAAGNNAAPGAGVRNLLVNADFSATAAVTTTAVDGAAIVAPWYALNQTNNTTAALQTLQQDGIPNNLRLTQSNATPQRHGVAQIVTAINAYRARGGSVTLSGQIRHSLTAPIRCAVLAWTGTADATTADVVNDWTSTSYTPGGFFAAANFAVVAVGVVTPTANTWTAITPITGMVPSSATNLVTVAWTEGTTAQTATLDITQVQLEVAASATAFEFLPNRLNLLAAPGWLILQQQTAAAAAQVDFVLPVGFSAYRLEIENLINASTATLILRSSTDGGATFHSGGTDYINSAVVFGPAASVFGSGGGSSSIALSSSMVAAGQFAGGFDLSPGGSGEYFQAKGTSSYLDAGGGSAFWSSGTWTGIYATFGAQNAIRVLLSSGNITSGKFTLLGRL